MRLSRFLVMVASATAICVLYVYQQAEIFRLGYVGQKRYGIYQELLDRNTLLRYNIDRKASLVNLGNQASRSAGYEMPKRFQVVTLPYLKQARAVRRSAKKENFFSRLLALKSQAEAKTINR